MTLYLILGGVAIASVLSLLFSTLTYSLRDYSKARLEDHLEKHGHGKWLEPTVRHTADLVFVTAVGRLFANILILVGFLLLFEQADYLDWLRYLLTVIAGGAVSLFCSVAIPSAIAAHAAEAIIAQFVRVLHAWRMVLLPVTALMHITDRLVGRAAQASAGDQPHIEQVIEEEILSVVEEGEKEGVVGEEEREMIESVIQFRDTTVGQIMTARPEIVALDHDATLDQVKRAIEESGHSRIPVYEGSLDHIIGVLYARDLLKFLGLPAETFTLKSSMRQALYVPESKPLRDLLSDFRIQKIHIAIVLDEYGGTAGLITIEDVLEELVGEISDEHEPNEPTMLTRLDDNTAEADARIYIDQLNRSMGLNLPEDAGYDTLGGFISTTLGKIPEPGTVFQHDGAKFTILEAEPQKVNRVKIELTPQPAEPEPTPTTTGK